MNLKRDSSVLITEPHDDTSHPNKQLGIAPDETSIAYGAPKTKNGHTWDGRRIYLATTLF